MTAKRAVALVVLLVVSACGGSAETNAPVTTTSQNKGGQRSTRSRTIEQHPCRGGGRADAASLNLAAERRVGSNPTPGTTTNSAIQPAFSSVSDEHPILGSGRNWLFDSNGVHDTPHNAAVGNVVGERCPDQ